MTSLSVSSRRARLLADALDGRGSAFTGSSPDGVLRERGVDLVDLALQLRTLAPEPPPGFTLALRERLMVVAVERELDLATPPGDSQPTEPVRPTLRRPPARAPRPSTVAPALASALATVLVVGGGAVGLTAVSSQSQPGDLLYPVKRGVESVALVLQGDPEAEGLILLEQSATRLTELEGLLASSGRSDRRDEALIVATLDDFATSTATAGEAFEEAAREDPLDPATIEQIRDFLSDATDQLARLAPALPPDSAGAYGRAASALNDLHRQAEMLCSSCAIGGSGDLVEVGAVVSTLGAVDVAALAVLREAGASDEAWPDRRPGTDLTASTPITKATEPVIKAAEPITKPITKATEPVTKPITKAAKPITKPITKATEPVIKAAEPVIEATKPITKAAKPITKPITKATKPVIKATKPTTKATEPVTKPITKAAKPITKPITKATEPVIKAAEPVIEATKPTEPVIKAAEPVIEATKPTTKATEPVIKAAEPITKATEPISGPSLSTVPDPAPPVLPAQDDGTLRVDRGLDDVDAPTVREDPAAGTPTDKDSGPLPEALVAPVPAPRVDTPDTPLP